MQQVPVLREFALISQQRYEPTFSIDSLRVLCSFDETHVLICGFIARGWTIDLPPEAEEMY